MRYLVLTSFALVAGCSTVIGLDEFHRGDPSTAGSSGAAGTGGNANGGTAGFSTGGTGGAGVVDCTGKPDGTRCVGDASNTLCLGEACAESECGDEYVDEAAGEFCDDGKNGDDTDGCTDACKTTCGVDSDCDDGNPCNGKESCSEARVCEVGSPIKCDDGNPCTADSCVTGDGKCAHQAVDDGTACGSGRLCLASACKTSACGDRWVDASRGEECDDGKDGDPSDGCKDDCRFTCNTNPDCSDDNSCTNDVCGANHTCTNTTITCSDGDACTADSCAPATGCVYTFIDEDKDGYAPFACKPGGVYANKGGDCRDSGTNAAAVNPGVTGYFTTDHGVPGLTPYDYDCSGSAERQYTSTALNNAPTVCINGWSGLYAAECGVTADWVTFTNCAASHSNRTQACH